MKRRWQEQCQAAGKDTSKSNILMGSNAQVALEKFARDAVARTAFPADPSRLVSAAQELFKNHGRASVFSTTSAAAS